MYFHDRKEAGRKLAKPLKKTYQGQDVAVLAVSPGGIIVGNEIAKELGAPMRLLLTETIDLPGVAKTDVIGLIDQEGHFTYNDMIPTGLLTELVDEMRNYIESQKLQKIHKLSRAISDGGYIEPETFSKRHVIVVSDGMRNGLSFEAASNYLKTIDTKSLAAAAPNVSVSAVDRLHVLADKIQVLDVLSNYLDTNHYFEDNNVPNIQILMKKTTSENSE